MAAIASVLALTTNESEVKFVNAVAEALGAQALVTSQIAGLGAALASGNFSACFLSASSVSDLDGVDAFFPENVDINKIHVIIPDGQDFDFVEMTKSHFFTNFLFRKFGADGGDAKATGVHYSRIVRASLVNEINGLHDLVLDEKLIFTKTLTESLQKRFVAEGISSQLQKKNWNSKIAMILANAVDELIMNAIFDAPADGDGNQIYSEVSRASAMSLSGERSVEVQTAFDEDYLLITVIDKLGTMNRSKLLQHIAGNQGKTLHVARSEAMAGAGLGLSIIMKNGVSLRFACSPKHRTEVSIIVKKADSYTRFRDQFRFLSTFVERE